VAGHLRWRPIRSLTSGTDRQADDASAEIETLQLGRDLRRRPSQTFGHVVDTGTGMSHRGQDQVVHRTPRGEGTRLAGGQAIRVGNLLHTGTIGSESGNLKNARIRPTYAAA